jgi:transcriptional regulator with GAF, ATPase, and Fis domain
MHISRIVANAVPGPQREFAECTIKVVRDGGELKLQTPVLAVDVIAGPERGKTASVPGPEIRIGSGKGCELVIHDGTVSRQHVIIRLEDGRIRVIDEGSKNGTCLDGNYVRDAYARPDSQIQIGDTTLRLRMANSMVTLELSAHERFGGLLGRSIAMRRMFSLLERVAGSDATVLVEGETGTGKELVAEAIHEHSRRTQGPFVVFDCSAVSASLIESELYGHVKGAFTGAVADRAGAFESADGGTLFLDEIGELPLDLQPKLLRTLERREVRRVGANTVRTVDLRVVAATNRALAREVDAGRFREDLFYRLNVVTVNLPPLRERLDDVPFLVEHFTKQMSGAPLPDKTVRAFAQQSWPGNVRELRNAVTRALSLGPPDAAQPPASIAEPAIDLSVPLKVGRDRCAEAYERAYITRALEHTGGNISRAAELANVNRRFVQRAMKRYGLRGDADDEGS